MDSQPTTPPSHPTELDTPSNSEPKPLNLSEQNQRALANLRVLLDLKSKHNDAWFKCTSLFMSHLEVMDDEWTEMIQLWRDIEKYRDDIQRRTDEIDQDDGLRFVTGLMKQQLEVRSRSDAESHETETEMKQLKVE